MNAIQAIAFRSLKKSGLQRGWKQEGVEISRNLEEFGPCVFNQNSVPMLYNYKLRAPHTKQNSNLVWCLIPGLRWPPNDQMGTELNTLLGIHNVMNFAQCVAIKKNKQTKNPAILKPYVNLLKSLKRISAL